MFEKKVSSIVVVCLLAVMMLSGAVFILPSASALTWTQDDDTEFNQGAFMNTEVIGTGLSAYVALTKGLENWGDSDPASEPPAREGPVMAYDSTRDVFIMFGGYDGSYLNDTWEYDASTNTWMEIITTGAPPIREWSSLAYDSTNDVFVLFGGYSSVALADTWEYDPSTQTWTETTPGFSPGTMRSYHLAFDSSANRVILAARDVTTSLFQTWAYDASLNSWQPRAPPLPPEERAFHSLTYDPSIGRTVLFGGVDTLALPPIFYSNVLEYDYSLDTWTETSPGPGPSARFGHAAAYRTWDQSVVVYGGLQEAGGFPIDTWKYEYILGSETWTDLGTIDNPGQRRYAAMDYDSLNNATVIFGGHSGIDYLNETWEIAAFYTIQGSFASSVFDSLYTDTIWRNIWWNLTPSAQPPNTNLTFQLAVSNSSTGPWNWKGPLGRFDLYYTNPGEQIWPGLVGRYLRYSGRLISLDGANTPWMDDVTIAYTEPNIPPTVVETDPADFNGTEWIELTRNITVFFSEPMNTATVAWDLNPDPQPGGWTEEWDSAGTILYLNHTVPFEESTLHVARITAGQDLDGNDLIPLPYQWIFITVSIYPYIEETEPAFMDVDVPFDYPIWINFSEPMDTATVMWTITPDPNPGAWVDQWQVSNRTLYLTHPTDYTQCLEYTVEVTAGSDPKGNALIPGPVPNPWTFTTFCLDPFVQNTDPFNKQSNVALDYPITVDFSKEVDNTTLSWTITPDPGGVWTETWGFENRTVVLDHSNPFTDCTPYTVEILDIQDLAGGGLIDGPVANPWIFMTTCASPYIIETDPSDGDGNVPTDQNISISFSEAVDSATFQWEITPDDVPPPGTWQESWLSDNVILSHPTFPLGQCTVYTVNVTYVEDFSGNPLVPGMIPNPWTFNTTCNMPVITATTPVNGSTGVPLTAPIIIEFNRPINTTSIIWAVSPDPNPGGWGVNWMNNNMTLELTHPTDYTEATQYDVVILAEDEDGNPVVPGPVPVPFVFTTGSANPYVFETDPFSGEANVELDRIINITFSEPMNTTTVNWNIDPDPGGWSPQWLFSNTTLSLSHSNPFFECVRYDFTVTDGEDLVGNPLVPGPVANPFSFNTTCVSPIIVETYPVNNTINYPLDGNLVVNFSEPMNTSTVTWFILPAMPHSGTWSNGNRTLDLTHVVEYDESTEYRVQIDGEDEDGNPLIPGPVPNPFYFTTIGENPIIVSTDPENNEMNVDLMAPVIITFSEEMDTGTVTWTISPDPNPSLWSEDWESGNTTLNLTHPNPFASGMLHTVEVLTGNDTVGNPLIPGPVPNPWFFTTVVPNPYIVDTYPMDGDIDVGVGSCIWINFSEEIDVLTFAWTIDPIIPGATWTEDWTNGNATLELCHDLPFAEGTVYTVTVLSADDMDGNALIPGPVPNPWSFTTEVIPPYIVWTYPPDGDIDVPLDAQIIVNFSEPMDQGSLFYSVVPDPGLSESWENNNMTLRLTHAIPYTECTPYTVTISAQDLQGQPLALGPVPNPWTFTTVCNPYITTTDPFDGETSIALDYTIIITFSEAIDTVAAFVWTITPDPLGWTENWSASDTLELSHSNPFTQCENYTVEVVEAYDMDGNPLVPGPVPNPWTFQTVCALEPPPGLTVTRVFPNNVRLDWNTVPGADSYNVYESSDRFSSFPSAWNVVNTANNFIELAHLADGLTHYYVVRAYDSGSSMESTNSTMGVKIDKAFTFSPTRTNVYWMSLPYNSVYTKASDIANELTESNVNVIGKWNRASQKIMYYYYARGKWRGKDFTITAGDGIYVNAITDFNWYIVGTDSSITIDLPYSSLPNKRNEHWISVPYTGKYALASDIVDEIEGGTGPNNNTYMIEIGKWDPSIQDSIKFYYGPSGWTGVDFAIEPGDGIYIKVVATYDWQPTLLTPEVS